MKLVLISDTHGKHADLTLPDGNVLIHAGDFSEGSGSSGRRSTMDFLEWFALQPFEHKIFIAGNHDFWAEGNWNQLKEEAARRGLIYLCDEWTLIDDVKFWGTPWVPNLPGWAFHERSPDYAERRFGHVHDDVDVMISHGPPRGIGDRLTTGQLVGCPALYRWCLTHWPLFAVSGHIHEAYGVVERRTTFVNASVLDEKYRLTNKPVVVEL